MKCPWMYGDKTRHCAAVHGLVVVSLSELERYCEGDNHKKCPVYGKRNKQRGLISLREYFSIYIRLSSELRRSRLLGGHEAEAFR